MRSRPTACRLSRRCNLQSNPPKTVDAQELTREEKCWRSSRESGWYVRAAIHHHYHLFDAVAARSRKADLTPSVSAVAATRIGLNLRRRHGCKVALHLKSLATFAQVVRDGEVEFHVDAVEHETASCCKEGRASVHRGDQTNPHQSMIGLECIGLIAI